MSKLVIASILSIMGLITWLIVALCYENPPSNGHKVGTVSGGLGLADLRIIYLEDGTRCAVLIGGYKAAISCDWR